MPVILGGLSVSSFSQSIQRELDKRKDSIISAEEAIIAGDQAYLESDFSGAVTKYREAFSRIPEGEKTKTLLEGARERYAQAAVQAARVMNRQGDRKSAIALVDEVLSKNVYPNYSPAQKMRSQLDDPIKTNPVATKEHARKVDEVRRQLYKAEGAFNLGKFDEATATYENVLRVDPYNKAARRGLERTSVEISDYTDAARDHTRAELLARVGAQWELDTNKSLQSFDNGTVGVLLDGNLTASLDAKLDTIFLPFVDFDEATLEEALEFLEGQSRVLDPELNEEKKGLSFVLAMGSGNSPEIKEILERRFSFQLRNVPVRQVLEYITQQTDTQFKVDTYAISVKPLGGVTDDVFVRRYSVSPNFLSQTAGGGGDVASKDPFAEDAAGGGTLAPRLTAREYLENRGVPFPEGSTASYTPALNELVVRTSSSGHDLVGQIVDGLTLQDPFAVVVETRMIRLSQEQIEEIGFDVTLQNLEANGEFVFSGGTQGNGSASDFFGSAPATAGLRSGDFATTGDPIDSLLESANTDVFADQQAAPGILSVIGEVNDTGLGVLLRGVNQKTGVDVVSQPSVVTRSGQQAIISSGREFTYPTEYEPPELPNSIGQVITIINIGGGVVQPPPLTFFASPAHPTAFETRNVGTILEVLPTVSADRRYADLAFNLRMDEFLGFVNYGLPITGGGAGGTGIVTSNDILQPIFDSVRLNTNLTIATGGTIVVGGLLSERVQNTEDKVPILGDLPFVGRFFSSDALRREKTVVMVFVTVRIVDPGGNPVQPSRN